MKLRLLILVLLAGTAVALINPRSLEVAWNRKLLLAILAIQPLILLSTTLAAVRLSMLAATPAASVWACFKALLLSYGVNTVAPARLGEVVRATYLRDRAAVPLSVGLASVFMERVIDVLLLAFLAVLALALFLIEPNAAFLSAACALAVALLLLPRFAPWITRAIALIPWQPLRDFSDRVVAHVVDRLRSGSIGWSVAAGAGLWLVCWLYTGVFLYVAASRPLDPAGSLIVLLALAVGGAVPVLPAGIGTFEAAVVLALGSLGYGFEEALLIAIALHAGMMLPCIVGGFLVAARERTGISSLIKQASSMLRRA